MLVVIKIEYFSSVVFVVPRSAESQTRKNPSVIFFAFSSIIKISNIMVMTDD